MKLNVEMCVDVVAMVLGAPRYGHANDVIDRSYEDDGESTIGGFNSLGPHQACSPLHSVHKHCSKLSSDSASSNGARRSSSSISVEVV